MNRNANKELSGKNNHVFDQVKLSKIPKMLELTKEVNAVVESSTWWELHGVDWAAVLIAVALVPVSLILLRSQSWMNISFGMILLSMIHSCLANKSGHIAAHGALTGGKNWNAVLRRLSTEVVGSFSADLAYEIHVKGHHPYTNIIGLGDSSLWKAPFLSRYMYMFVAPTIFLPILAPVLSIAGLIQKRAFIGLLVYIFCSGFGLATITYLLMAVSGYTLLGALLVIWFSRSILAAPYIHVNIFQHIGLPMYSQEDRPVRIYQMSTGCLNLPRNPILDWVFGHSLVSCHVEHHLFPRLSDNMCLKVKPVVSKFLKEHGLPYKEDTYMGRLNLFLEKYETLMVKAPPITHFVGLQ